MARFQRGQLENYIRGIVLDVLAETFNKKINRGNEEETVDFSAPRRGGNTSGRRQTRGTRGTRGRRRTRGSVTNPKTDKRLKRNRSAVLDQ